ncbi:hypothetical protein MUG78_16965 [Gordonia alkaliphila]|uniref:hypothetical protein n=1 Tax=Gordonia alkaliphila TaxID=1053547 RepID=UPI001FF1B09F|nr:hypothetical protein [Gordonia alkaliphila]MCK0441093.1 hypothetical protein [Gordonia alkaliphila]
MARGTAGGWERDEEVADGVCLSDDYADSVAAGFEAAFGPGAGVLGVAAVVVYGTADDDSDPGYLRVEVTTATEPADTIEAWFSRCGQPVLDLWESLTDPAGQRYLYAAAQPGR